MDPNGLSRRAFLRSAGATAAAVAAGEVISLGPDSVQASSADTTTLPDYERYDGLGLAALVKARQVSAAELLAAAMERVEQRNPATNAVVNYMYDQARAAIAAGLPSGPFTGVPYLIKDLGPLYAGTVTTFGSSIFRDFVADHDSEMAVRLKRAGLVIFGKTHSPEFGLSTSSESRLFGATHNPWNPEYSAGGSSGGSAAAIAAGMLPMAHGTDGGGSIRIPASCCGLFGLKPTRGRIPLALILASGGAGWPALTRSRARCATARHCSTRPPARTSETPIGRRRRAAPIWSRSGPIPGGSGLRSRRRLGTATRSIQNAWPLSPGRRSSARALATTWRRPRPRSTKPHAARPSRSSLLRKPAPCSSERRSFWAAQRHRRMSRRSPGERQNTHVNSPRATMRGRSMCCTARVASSAASSPATTSCSRPPCAPPHTSSACSA